MGWQDDPVVGGGSAAPWANDPVVGAPSSSDTPASFNQGPASLGQMSILEKPANVSMNDFMLAHLGEWGKGLGQIGQTADDTVRAATNTFGLGDRFAAGMSNLTGIGGGDLAQQRAISAARAKADPVASTIGTIAGYGPLAEQGIAARLGGGVMGTAAEFGTGGALAGAGDSNAKTWGGTAEDALAGGAAGLAGGSIVGGAAKYIVNPIANAVAKAGRFGGPLSTPADITASTKQTKEDAYAALKEAPVPGISDAAANARAEIEASDTDLGALQKGAPQTMAVLKRIDKSLAPATGELTGQDAANYLTSQRGSMAPDDYNAAWRDLAKTGKITTPDEPTTPTAYDVRDWLDQLRDIQGPNAGAENALAPIVERHLNDAIGNAGVSDMFDSAAAANKVFRNAQFLQQGRENLKYLGQSPSGEAARIAQTYYPSGAADLEAGSPTQAAAVYKRLSDITKAGGGIPSAYSMMHAVYPATEAAGAGLGAMVGGPGGAFAGEIAGGLAGGAAKTAMSSGLSKMQSAATLNAMNRAYPDMTGKSVAAPSIDVGRALRALIFGQAAPSL